MFRQLVERTSMRRFFGYAYPCQNDCLQTSLRIQWGGGLRGLQPPLNFHTKIVVIHVAVVIDLVVTSSNNVCLCALNGVAV